MPAPSVSMNIGVFKDLNEQLQTVSTGTDVFKAKVIDLVKELQGLSSIINSMPQGLSGLAQQMQTAGGAFSPQKVTQAFQSPPQQQQPPQQQSPIQQPTILVPGTPSPQPPIKGPSVILPGMPTPQPPVSPTTATDLSGGITKILADFLAESKNLRAAIENLGKKSPESGTKPPQPSPTKPDEPPFVPPTPGSAPVVVGRLGIFTEHEKQFAQRTFRQTGIQPASIEDTLAAERLTQPLSQVRITENIDKLSEKLGKVEGVIAKTLVGELEKLKATFAQNGDVVKNFNESLRKYNEAVSQKRPEMEVQRAYEDLSKSVKEITDASEKYGEAIRLGQDMVGPPGGGRFGRAMQGVQRALPYVAGVVAGGMDLAKESFSFFKDMESQDIPATRQIAVGRGQLEQRAFQNYSEQFSTYNARNLMRWYGDVLSPGSFEYAGPKGFERAKETALTEQSREQSLKESERRMQMSTGATDIGLSAAQLLGSIAVKKAIQTALTSVATGAAAGSAVPGLGTAVGAVAGGYMAFDAIKDLISGVNRMQSSLAASPALEVSGGRAGTMYGEVTSSLFGNQPAGDIARRTRERFAIDRANENLERARELQESEINRFPHMERAIQQTLELKQMQYRALPQLGRYAGLPSISVPGVTGLPTGGEVYEKSYQKAMAEMRGEGPVEKTAQQKFWEDFNESAKLPVQITPQKESRQFLDFEKASDDAFRGITSQERDYLRSRFEALSPKERGDLVTGPAIQNAYAAAQTGGALTADTMVDLRGAQATRWLKEYRSPEMTKRREEDRIKIASDAAMADQRQATQDAFDKQMGIMMQKDKNGNYANLPFANLGLGPTEVQQRAYSYQNLLGVGQMRTTGQTVGSADFMRLNRMSLGGLGTFEQLGQNVQSLQALTGQRTDQAQKDLERIFAKGVEAGFNNSRLAQTLVQTSTSMAESLNLRNVAGVTSSLLEGARIAGGGRIDERNLRDAASGLQAYAAFTGQNQGPMAALRLGGILQGQMTPGQGTGLLFGMNAVQANDSLQQIEELGGAEKAWRLAQSSDPKDRQKIRDPNLRTLLFNAKSPDDLKTALSGVRKTGTVVASSAWNLWKKEGEKTLEETQGEILKELRDAGSDKNKKQAAETKLDRFAMTLRARFADTFGAQGADMSSAYLGQMLADPSVNAKQRNALARQLNVDVGAEQKTQAAFQTAITKFGETLIQGKPSLTQYGQLMETGDMKRTLSTGETLTGKQIRDLASTPEAKLTDEQKRQKKEIEAGLEKETVSSLMAQRQMSMKEMAEPPKQMVMSGIEQTAAERIGEAVSRAMKRDFKEPGSPTFLPFGNR